MKLKALLVCAIAMFVSSQALGYGDAGCGLGSLIWTKNTFSSQMLAVTTNMSFYSQTFGITSGTSGCKRKGLVREDVEQEVFVTMNYESLKNEIAQGEGENLTAFRQLMGCSADSPFAYQLQQGYRDLVPHSETTADQFLRGVRATIANDSVLTATCQG